MTKEHFCILPDSLNKMDNAEVREHFLLEDLFQPGKCVSHYVQEDRLLIFGLMPAANEAMTFESAWFQSSAAMLERREMGIVNLGEQAEVTVDGKAWTLEHKDCMYVGMGKKNVTVRNANGGQAKLYAVSCPAHHAYSDGIVKYEQAVKTPLGCREQSNERTIVKYIVPETIPTCQLLMGITTLKTGSVWNTMPPHTHIRRQEVYLYCDAEDEAVFHFMGQPQDVRTVVMHNEQAIISPSWAVHFAAGTAAYSFVWAMTGENQDFNDVENWGKLSLR